jgi:type IV pilus assembly protein PilC
MPDYHYRAVNAQGQLVSGTISGDSTALVQQKLKNDGLKPVEINEGKGSTLALPNFGFKREISGEALSHFCRQLSIIMMSGVNLLRGLEIMAEQSPDKQMKAEITRIHRQVQTGRSISEAMTDRESPIPALMASMVATGEASGTLEDVLRSMAIFYDKEYRIKQRIKSASIYPLVMAGMAVLLIAFFFNFLLPQMLGMITANGGELPKLTQIVIGISEFTTTYWYILVVSLLAITAFSNFYLKTPAGRLRKARLIQKIPMLGKTIRDLATMRFARATNILIKSGLPLLQGLEYVKQNVNNALAEQAVDYAIDGLQRGETLAENLANVKFFDSLAIQMFSIGEETGELEGILSEMADFYDKESDAGFTKLLAMVEPMMLVIIGSIVSVIIISVMLPMLDMFSHIQR